MPNAAQPRDATQTSGDTAQRPVEKFRDGPVHVSIWQSEGAKGAFRIASFELRYRNREGQWQGGHTYTSSALLHLESAAREAHLRIERWQQSSRHNSSLRPSI